MYNWLVIDTKAMRCLRSLDAFISYWLYVDARWLVLLWLMFV